ncbi:hypothetical protein A2U01_0088270, partial [Trifolium medium]|nr:hypothetical protein [Trifolium medium]
MLERKRDNDEDEELMACGKS